ncbi:MAG: YciI family protein [Hyphomicrobium sp.]|uniref:YciI family protein n=1 Tax=Hyphomicrobium sp. TaxID=82 RepID=UPI003D0FA586
MKFMMFVTTDGGMKIHGHKPGGAEDWIAEAGSRRITGDRLRPISEGKTVRVRDGQTVVTDGPFAELKEVIVGFDILECETMREAIEIASRHPLATTGSLELRAFWPFED